MEPETLVVHYSTSFKYLSGLGPRMEPEVLAVRSREMRLAYLGSS
jgi:hypothetical protein